MTQPLARPRHRLEVWHLLLMLALLVLLFFAAGKVRPFAYLYARYTCIHCGVKRTVSRRTFAGATYRERTALEETPISRVLNPGLRRACSHEWYELDFGASTSSFLAGGEQADGGSDFMLVRLLLIDEDFARDLAQTPHPQEVWETICRAGQASPRQADGVLSEWYAERPPFAQWWTANEARVKRLTASPRPSR